MTTLIEGAGVYDFPQYWDLAFRDETRDEVAFVEAAAKRWLDQPLQRIYEPGCGGGRLVIALAAKGLDVVASDLNPECVRYVKQRLRRRRLTARVEEADMCPYVARPPVDLAICPVNTIRHLLNEADVVAHMQSVAASVRKGGLYIIGLHLMPPDADEEDSEEWTARHGSTTVEVALKVTAFDRVKRLEKLQFAMTITSPTRDMQLISEFDYRLYTAAQMEQTLAKLPEWELISVHDFWYDIDESFPLNDDRADTVLVLRRT